MSCSKRVRRDRRGFSLVEIMVVLVIMGLLAGVVTINVRGYLLRAKQTRVRQDIVTLEHALDTYFGAYSRYPTSQEGLAVLAKSTQKFPEPLLKNLPKDPWNNPYQYYCLTSRDCEVLSFGADNRKGGTGADTDISNKDLEEDD